MGIVTDSKEPADKKDPDEVIIYKLYKLVAPEKSDDMKNGIRSWRAWVW